MKFVLRPLLPAAGGEVLPMDERPGDVLTIDELSAYLKEPQSTLEKIVRVSEVPGRKTGRQRRFLREAIVLRWENLPEASAAQAGARLRADA